MKTVAANCVIDRDVLNEHNYQDFTSIGLAVFAPLCGRNRGAFVLNPTDGATWGCASFPPSFGERVNVDIPIVDSNAIKLKYDDKNITAAEAVDLVDLFVQSVYFSTSDVDKDVMACDVGGLAKLSCEHASGRTIPLFSSGGDSDDDSDDEEKDATKKIRSVTLAGLFVPEPWATGDKPLPIHHARNFYNAQDFSDMKTLGLNTVQIPVPLNMFDKHSSHHHGKKADSILLLGEILQMAKHEGLGAVIELVVTGKDDDDDKKEEHHSIEAAAEYAASTRNVIALSLPSSAHVDAARDASKKLPLLIPTIHTDLVKLHSDDPNVFAALKWDHTKSVADIASFDGASDRNKMFYHEAIACSARAPIEYAACYRDMPAYMTSGFDVSIDDCVNADNAAIFTDYGQCGRIAEIVDSPWWFAHRSSLLARQMTTFETGLGWTYPAWKLFGDNKESTGILDSPAKLKSLKDVAAAGLFPSLHKPLKLPACLNPPLADFILGDDTVAPTAAPPPACDGGWWDPKKGKCAYWIPPPPTAAPTPCPKVTECKMCEAPEPCPATASTTATAAANELSASIMGGPGNSIPPTAFFGGVMATLVIGAFVGQFVFGRGRRSTRRSEYSLVPDSNISV